MRGTLHSSADYGDLQEHRRSTSRFLGRALDDHVLAHFELERVNLVIEMCYFCDSAKARFHEPRA